jgi:hypothetical protein
MRVRTPRDYPPSSRGRDSRPLALRLGRHSAVTAGHRRGGERPRDRAHVGRRAGRIRARRRPRERGGIPLKRRTWRRKGQRGGEARVRNAYPSSDSKWRGAFPPEREGKG